MSESHAPFCPGEILATYPRAHFGASGPPKAELRISLAPHKGKHFVTLAIFDRDPRGYWRDQPTRNLTLRIGELEDVAAVLLAVAQRPGIERGQRGAR